MEGDYREKEVLYNLYVVQDLDQEEIAEMYDVAQRTISYWIDKFGIDTTPQRTKKLRDGEWLYGKYWKEYCSTTEIADILGCSDFAVCTWMEKHGIERRTADHQQNWVCFYTDGSGYEAWSTSVSDTSYTMYIHRLLAVSEHGVESVKDMVVHHKNEIKWDNRPSNIELMTNKEHSQHHS